MKLHKNCDGGRLVKYGFSKYGTRYMYKVVLYRYKKDIVIEMLVTAEIGEKENNITYDILGNGEIYVPYYNNEYSKNNFVLRKVKRKINSEIKKLEESEIIEPEPKRYGRKSKR